VHVEFRAVGRSGDDDDPLADPGLPSPSPDLVAPWRRNGAGTVLFCQLGNCEDWIHTISAVLRGLWLRQGSENSCPSREVAWEADLDD
jgi:hypothetical protein